MAANDVVGIITRIALKNFVTYDEVVVKPGKNLNLIIGANGTGKSTIVSAIVLGLGGSPKVIGRASTVADYVKGGQETASIEIDLQNGPNKVVTIKRQFDTKNITTWFLNNVKSNSKVVKDVMDKFNIQVDNLCQFLPQDKVQEFSNLTPQDLLVETERSVGDPKLLEYHTMLKEFRVTQAELENQLETSVRLLNKEKQTCDTLKDRVGHIEEQKTIEKKLKTLRQKKAWVIYQEKRDEFNKAKVERDEAKKVKDKLEKKLKPIQLEIAKLKNAIQTTETVAKDKNSIAAKKSASFTKLQDDIEGCESLIDDQESECQRDVKAELERDQHIAEQIEHKNKLENDLQHKTNEVGPVEEINAKLASILQTMSNHRNKADQLRKEQMLFGEKRDSCSRKIAGLHRNLQEVQNIEMKRLELLSRMDRDAYNGVMWLRSNKHLFSNPIYEPMLLSINVKDSRYAKYLENVIPRSDLCAFVCEDKNDMNNLIHYLRGQQKLKVNIVHSDPNREVNDQPYIPIEHLRQYGFEHYMLSLVDAPKTILNYLISNYYLHKIPIGNDNITHNIDNIPDDVRFFFSPQKSYKINYSEYTKEKSTTESAVGARGWLSITIDSATINNIQDRLAQLDQEQKSYQLEIDSFNEKIAQEERKVASHKDMRVKLETDANKMRDLQRKINNAERNLRQIQENRKSVEQIRADYKAKIKGAISSQLGKYQNYNKCLDDYYKTFIISEEMKVEVKIKKHELTLKENDSQEVREQYENAERNFRNLENEMKPLRQELEKLFEEAKQLTDNISIADTPAFKSFQTSFAKLPATLEEILTEIQKTQAKAFNVNDRNEAQRIVHQFNTAKKNVERCTREINAKEEELLKVTEDITKVKEEWLPMLTSLVEKINKNFSACFTKMKCAGEVALIDGGTPMDFAKYGLRIKVKFRDADELQALSRNHQSGGERAVTTAAYMISLQELTRVPFRCVDEINQGMDATNERRVFELIVNITSVANSAQYFLLTPKLLPDLKYNESMTVLTVFNGKYMAPGSAFDIHDNIDQICRVVKNRRRAER